MHTARFLVAAAFAAAAAASPALAAPVTISIAGGGWLAGSGWQQACAGPDCDPSHDALNVSWEVAGGLAGTSFSLNGVGESHTVLFGWGRLAEEDGHIFAGETDDLGLSAWLALSVPVEDETTHDAQVAATAGPLKDQGNNVDLAIGFDPVSLSFGDGGELQLELSPLAWNCQGNGACVYDSDKPQGTQAMHATFTLLKEAAPAEIAATAIPEPSSMLLLGAGLAGMGLRRRRQG